MNLVFSFHDQLFWIHNFLPKNIYKRMYVDFIKNRNKLNLKKSNVSWRTFKEEVDDMSDSFNQTNTEQLKFFDEYHTLLKHQPFVKLMNYNFYSHLRRYKYGKHLAWHEDDYKGQSTREYAATFYFNKTWGESWGGELMFKSSLGSGFIPIVGNSVVLVKTGLTHKVNPNLKKTHPRLSIQTWVHRGGENEINT